MGVEHLVQGMCAVHVPIVLVLRWLTSEVGVQLFALATLVLDLAVVAFFGIFAFDESSVHFLLFFLLAAEAAQKFRLIGAVSRWAASSAACIGRGLRAEAIYGYLRNLPSAAFRRTFGTEVGYHHTAPSLVPDKRHYVNQRE